MTQPGDLARYTELTPADGVETTARRMIDQGGLPMASDEIHKYIRVIGSSLRNLEPHFWGDGMAIARFPDRRGKGDHYYVTDALMRISLTICKRDKSEKDDLRDHGFSNLRGFKACLRADGITPWQEVPEEYGRRRYLMYLCQEHAETLRAVGFSQEAIDACARGKPLGRPVDKHGNPLMRDGKEVEFDVHHRVPLQAGGSNGIDNLCLVDASVHNPFFHKGDDPVINKMPTGEVREIALTVPRPDIHVVAVGLNAHLFIDDGSTTKGIAA